MKKWTLWQNALVWGLTGFALKGAVAFGAESLMGVAAIMFSAALVFIVLDIVLDEIERRWPRDK